MSVALFLTCIFCFCTHMHWPNLGLKGVYCFTTGFADWVTMHGTESRVQEDEKWRSRGRRQVKARR